MHQFGIVNDVDPEREYVDYQPWRYQSVGVDDELVNQLATGLQALPTYWHSLNRPAQGLAYWGITLIPPESLPALAAAVADLRQVVESAQLAVLAALVADARRQQSTIIHFGI